MKQISDTTVRVTLSAKELAAYHINFSAMGQDNPETVAMLLSIIAEASIRCDVPLDAQQLFVEAFHRENGDCLLYLSVVPEADRSVRTKWESYVSICDFASPQALAAGCQALQGTGEHFKSACYQQGGHFRLVIQSREACSVLWDGTLAAYGSCVPASEQALSITLEHYHCIQRRNAIEKIAALMSPREDISQHWKNVPRGTDNFPKQADSPPQL